MNKKIKILFFAIGLILFIYLVNDFGVQNILDNVQKTGWWFLPIIGVWLVVYLLNSGALYLIAVKKDTNWISFYEIFTLTLSSFAINYVTPFVNLGGEPYRVFALKEAIGSSRAVSSTILYNMLHILSHLFIWLTAVVVIFIILPVSLAMLGLLITAGVILLVAILFFFSRHSQGIFRSLMNLLRGKKIFGFLYRRLQKRENTLNQIDDEIKEFYHERKSSFYKALFMEYAARIISSLEFLFILKSIGIDINVFQSFYISAVSSLMLNILFFMPMEIGAREGSLYLIMESINISSGIGIYTALVNRVREFFWILAGLVFIQLAKYRKTEKEILDYVKNDI